MRLRHPKDAKTRISYPNYGIFEFNPEGEVPDDAKPVIDYLIADGYKVVGKAQSEKDEPVKVEIPPKPEKEPETFTCEVCGKKFNQIIALRGHSRSHKK